MYLNEDESHPARAGPRSCGQAELGAGVGDTLEEAHQAGGGPSTASSSSQPLRELWLWQEKEVGSFFHPQGAAPPGKS